MGFLYDVLFFLFALAYLPLFVMKGKCGQGFWERLGWVPEAARRKLAGKSVVWVHAVSVGEAVLAMHFAEALKRQKPSVVILFTVTTPAAREVVQNKKKAEDILLCLPVDTKGAVRRFIDSVEPKILILFETEIWPNLIWAMSRRRIPVYIVNGRISEKALSSYRRIRFFIGPVLRHIRKIGVQDDTMRRRFVSLGADEAQVVVTGNLKYELRPDAGLAADWAQKIRNVFGAGNFLLMAGSTHAGEEEALFRMYRPLALSYPRFRMVLAPRHTDRVASVLEKAKELGIPAHRLSEAAPVSDSLAPVLILDKMGVLSGLYSEADLVFLGGSLVPVGGHNPTEPAAFGKAIVFGPFMQNFKEMVEEFLRSDAALQVRDAEELGKQIEILLKDPRRRGALGAHANDLMSRHRGALAMNLDLVIETVKGALTK